MIQNGCGHALTRKEIESMVSLFPESWPKGVKSIALYQGKESEITVEYYKKEQILGLFSPKDYKNQEAKVQAVQEMLIGLACIAENADLPKNISKSARMQFLEKTSTIRERCLLLANNSVT